MRIGTFSLAAFFLFCLALNILTLYNGHNWGGDFAQYLIHAQNLLSHRPYTAGIMLEQNIIYPPGFPLLLAPWIQFWGVNFILLKTLNIFCWIGALLFLHRLAKEHTDRSMALLCTMLLSVSSVFFVFKQNILSDMPFMFFILGGLCLIQSRQWAWALIFIYWAILTRSAGLVLSLSAIFYFAWIQRDNLKTWTITLVTIVALGTQLWITRGIHPAFFKALSVNPAQTVQFLLQYAPTVWQSLAWFYAPGQTTFTSGIFLLFSWVLTITAPILWIGLIFFGIKKCLTRKISLIECFCFLYLLLLFFWSYFGDSPQQFNRFLFPIVGLIPLLFYHALKDAASHHILKVAMVIFILINAINTLGNINFNDDDIIGPPSNRGLIEWVKTNTKPTDHFMFWEPRTITLMTGRVGTTLAWLAFNPTNQWARIANDMQVNVFIVDRKSDKNLIAAFLSQPTWVKIIWQNKDYFIFQTIS